MNRFYLHLAAVAWIGVVVSAATADETPSRTNISGNWLWTSYLLDPNSLTSGMPLPSSTATVWAIADLKLVEKSQTGTSNTITGELVFKGSGITLKVTGRRINDGDTEEFLFRGEGERPGGPGKPPIALKYEIRGSFSSAWPKGGPQLNLRGYIRNIEGDPFFLKGIGAFVLIPAEPKDADGQAE
jgi:hypothetical protein